MALIPLNTFKTKTAILSTATTGTVYTAPVGTTSIVLMAQVSNVTTMTQYVNFVHRRNIPIFADAQGNGGQPAGVDSFLVKNFAIPADDAGTVLSGKLIVESLDSVRAYSNNPNSCQLVLSILETAND